MNTQMNITLENRSIKFFYSKSKMDTFLCGRKKFTFKTNDKIVNFCSDLGFKDINYPFAYEEKNIHLMLHRKYENLFLFKNMKLQQKNEKQYLIKKDDELKGDNEGIIQYGNDFINCKVVHDRD